MVVKKLFGCSDLSPWIRNSYNVTLTNGTSTDELPGHLNLCFFDTAISVSGSVVVLLIFASIFYHALRHHENIHHHKDWSASVVRWRHLNLILPVILFVLSSVLLFEDASLPKLPGKTAYMEGYDLEHTNRGLLIGSSSQCISYLFVLLSICISSQHRQIWFVPRGARWWILMWTAASLIRVQCTIEAIAGYGSVTNWPFGELEDLETRKLIQWLRLVRFVCLLIFAIVILVQRDIPSFEFDVSPSETQLERVRQREQEENKGKSGGEETKISSMTKPLLESEDEVESKTTATTTVRIDSSWIRDAPRGAERILRRVHSLDTRSEMHERVDTKKQRSDETGASIFQLLTFSWMNDQVKAGKQAPLQTRQLHLLHGKDLPDKNSERLLEMYRKLGGGEICDENFRKKASVPWTIFYVYKWPLCFAASLSMCFHPSLSILLLWSK